MKFGKKILAVVLAGVLALAMLTACGGSEEGAPFTVDLEKSKTVLGVINSIRDENGMDTVDLNEEASLLMGDFAKAAAENSSREQELRLAARTKIETTVTIDGSACSVGKTTIGLKDFSVDNTAQVKAALQQYYKTQVLDDYDYVAIATCEKNGKAAIEIFTLTLKDAE